MRNSIAMFVVVGLLALFAGVASAQAPNPLDVLKSDAPIKDKADACRELSIHGTAEAVPVLAPMLLDEKLSHYARGALEPMPFPEAGQALRDALGKTTGNLKAGMINSLAIRKDETVVPELVKLLSDGDAVVAQASADALGMLATPEAIAALGTAAAKANASPANLKAFCDGLLGCAERLTAKGQNDEATAIYDRVFEIPNTPSQVRVGALRGAILTRGAEKGLPLLTKALAGEDEDLFAAALRTARELEGEPAVTTALVETLPGLAPNKKVPVIQVLGQRANAAGGPALLAEAKEGPEEVRIAAVRALTRMSYNEALPLITQLAVAEEGDLTKTAQTCLSDFPTPEGDAALEALLKNEKAETRRVAVDLIGQGGLEKPAGLLIKVAQKDPDESVRVAAFKALQDTAGIDEIPPLLETLLKTKSDAEMKAVEKALESLCVQQRGSNKADVTIQKAVYGVLSTGPSADVTAKVQELVLSGAIQIEASNANFGDSAPGKVKELRVDYTSGGKTFSGTVAEGEALRLTATLVPSSVEEALCAAFDKAQDEAKPAVLRLLGATGGSKAFEIVQSAASSGGDAVKDTALRTLCSWPTSEALPRVMELAKNSPDETIKMLALRGTVRLLREGQIATQDLLTHYVDLMSNAKTPDEKKVVLGGLAKVARVDAFDLALRQIEDESVKAEAVQAAIAIANELGAAAQEDKAFFNGKDLTGWEGNAPYWRFEAGEGDTPGSIVGGSDQPIPRNEFIWSNVPVGDFYLSLDVKLEPNSANAGVQFRSKQVDDHGQALGYQADMGQDVWGRLYHEHGRGKLDWTDRGEAAVKPGEWNHYEILAVGPAIWTAINGKLSVAFLDLVPEAERSGLIAVQIHGGPPQTVHYRMGKLIHNPEVALPGISTEVLISELKAAAKQ